MKMNNVMYGSKAVNISCIQSDEIFRDNFRKYNDFSGLLCSILVDKTLGRFVVNLFETFLEI